MKKTFYLLLVFFAFLSCNKQDTPPTLPGKTPEDYLVDKKWKFDYITFVQDNQLFYYKRNGSGNTASFPDDAVLFKKDGTGTYTANINTTYSITWGFTDNEKTIIKYTIHDYDKGLPKTGTNVVITWENVVLNDNFIKYAEIYTYSDGKSTISSAKRIPL